MGLADLARQAIHAGTGVPRLYVAATRAGLGASEALEVLRISQAALAAAATHGRGVPGRTNAVRHFTWQAALSARFDADVARAIATAQETGTPNRRDSDVDARNNAVGQAYGAAHADDLSGLSPGDLVARLVPVALEKWDADELVWVRPH